jgi:peptidyl-prolyl cis-trans isomerase C
LCAVLLGLSACQAVRPPVSTPGSSDQPATQPVITETVVPTITATVTPTAEPAALTVNGEVVSIAAFDAELARYQAALTAAGQSVADAEARQVVLDALVDERLLAQAAVDNGYTPDEADLQARYDGLISAAGGEDAWSAWLTAQNYTPDTFRRSLAGSLAAAWQRDEILKTVPVEMEQVHARQILVLNAGTAEEIYRQLQAGADFATLVLGYDPVTGGDLGWFPRGYLTLPALEEAAFSLQPGETSSILESDFGYHILQVIDRKTTALSPDALQTLQRAALQDWLAARRSASTIEILLP